VVVVLAIAQHAQLPGTLDLVEPDLIAAIDGRQCERHLERGERGASVTLARPTSPSG
jgi:hypothetical protein